MNSPAYHSLVPVYHEASIHDSLQPNLTHSLRKRKLPPYGKHALSYIREKGIPANGAWVITGDGPWGSAWDHARQLNRHFEKVALVYDRALPPSGYLWPVSGCECLLWLSGLPDNTAIKLVKALIRDGAKKVCVSSHTGAGFSFAAFTGVTNGLN